MHSISPPVSASPPPIPRSLRALISFPQPFPTVFPSPSFLVSLSRPGLQLTGVLHTLFFPLPEANYLNAQMAPLKRSWATCHVSSQEINEPLVPILIIISFRSSYSFLLKRSPFPPHRPSPSGIFGLARPKPSKPSKPTVVPGFCVADDNSLTSECDTQHVTVTVTTL